MKTLKTTTELVKRLLETKPFTRNSDDRLYVEVIRTVDKQAARFPIWYVLEHRKYLKLPPFESVRRSRQKIQREHPELKACDKVKTIRDENEQKYREYARG